MARFERQLFDMGFNSFNFLPLLKLNLAMLVHRIFFIDLLESRFI